MPYAKTILTDDILDDMRINLSAQPNKLSAEPVCDFCGDDSPVCVYHASRTSTGREAVGAEVIYRWCACQACEQAVDTDDWYYLENRLVKVLATLLPEFEKSLIRRAARISLDEFHRCSIKE